jgi:hypothetical protein
LTAGNNSGSGKGSELIKLHILCVLKHLQQKRHFVTIIIVITVAIVF